MSSSIVQKLAYLFETKQEIKDAIIGKGRPVSDEQTFRSYAEEIRNIEAVTAEDEGKVVQNGELAGQTPRDFEYNGTYDTTYNDRVNINVPNRYEPGDEGKVVQYGLLVPQDELEVTVNGTYDTMLNNLTTVNVPNTYAEDDEGKVVQAGVLVSQTGLTVVTNGTYDTTTKDEVVVEVPESAVLVGKVVTANGTYDPVDDEADGYLTVTVAIPPANGEYF